MRNAFSTTDDQRLVEYIAKYNPATEGRQGKILYQRLSENSWAGSHTWQSWRERYKKNMDIFDVRIARYLKGYKEATESKPPKKTANANGVGRTTQKGTIKTNLPEKAKDTGASKRNVGDPSMKPTNRIKVPASKEKANASADSGYASARGNHPNAYQGNSENRQLSTREAPSVKTRQQGTSGLSKESSVPGSQSKKPTESIPVAQPEESEESSDAEENEPVKGPVDDDDYVYELFGSYVEDGEEEEYQEEPPSSSVLTPASMKVYSALRVVPDPIIIEKEVPKQGTSGSHLPSQALTPRKPTSSKHPHTAVHRPAPDVTQVMKRLLKRKIHDEDPFVDNTPPFSPPGGRSMDLRAPPVLKEGPFRNTYVPARRKLEDDDVAWPPKRRRKNDEQPEMTQSRPLGHSSMTIAPEQRRQAASTQPQQCVRMPKHQHVNAIASSSRVMLQASNAMRRDPLLKQTAKGPPHQQVVPQRIQGLNFVAPKVKHTECIIRPDSTSQLPLGPAGLPTKRQKIEDRTHPASQSSVGRHEPSAATSSRAGGESRGRARAENPPSNRRIDLREERLHIRRSSQRSSIVSSRSSPPSNANSTSKENPRRRESAVSSGSRHSRHSIVNVEDAQLIPLFKQEFAELGREYGFSPDIAEATFKETGSLGKTRVVLENLNRVMRGAQQALYDRMPHLFGRSGEEDLDDEDESIPIGLVPRQAHTARKEEEGNRKSVDLANSHGEGTIGSLTKRNRPSLSYKPVTADETEDMSDYSPPSKTRAHRYTKLRKEGREKEDLNFARERDHPSRTGGNFTLLRSLSREVGIEDADGVLGEVGSSPGIQQYHTARLGMGPSSPLEMEPSPTPAAKSVPKQRVTQGEDDGSCDDLDVALDGNDSIGDSNQVQVYMEYKRLASEVTLHAQEAMLAFERKNDPWLLKQWSLGLVEERLAAAREAQEIRNQQQKHIAAKNARRLKEES